jgi:hypothetical protein
MQILSLALVEDWRFSDVSVVASSARWEIRVRSARKTFPRESIHTEISPLRYASVEMTKGKGGASRESSC